MRQKPKRNSTTRINKLLQRKMMMMKALETKTERKSSFHPQVEAGLAAICNAALNGNKCQMQIKAGERTIRVIAILEDQVLINADSTITVTMPHDLPPIKEVQ